MGTQKFKPLFQSSQDGSDTTSSTIMEIDFKKPGPGILKSTKRSIKRKKDSLCQEVDETAVEPLLQKEKDDKNINKCAKSIFTKPFTKTEAKEDCMHENYVEILGEKNTSNGNCLNEKKPIIKTTEQENFSGLVNVPLLKNNENSKFSNAISKQIVTEPNDSLIDFQGGSNIITGRITDKVKHNDLIQKSITDGIILKTDSSPVIFTTAKIHLDGNQITPFQVNAVPITSVTQKPPTEKVKILEKSNENSSEASQSSVKIQNKEIKQPEIITEKKLPTTLINTKSKITCQEIKSENIITANKQPDTKPGINVSALPICINNLKLNISSKQSDIQSENLASTAPIHTNTSNTTFKHSDKKSENVITVPPITNNFKSNITTKQPEIKSENLVSTSNINKSQPNNTLKNSDKISESLVSAQLTGARLVKPNTSTQPQTKSGNLVSDSQIIGNALKHNIISQQPVRKLENISSISKISVDTLKSNTKLNQPDKEKEIHSTPSTTSAKLLISENTVKEPDIESENLVSESTLRLNALRTKNSFKQPEIKLKNVSSTSSASSNALNSSNNPKQLEMKPEKSAPPINRNTIGSNNTSDQNTGSSQLTHESSTSGALRRLPSKK